MHMTSIIALTQNSELGLLFHTEQDIERAVLKSWSPPCTKESNSRQQQTFPFSYAFS